MTRQVFSIVLFILISIVSCDEKDKPDVFVECDFCNSNTVTDTLTNVFFQFSGNKLWPADSHNINTTFYYLCDTNSVIENLSIIKADSAITYRSSCPASLEQELVRLINFKVLEHCIPMSDTVDLNIVESCFWNVFAVSTNNLIEYPPCEIEYERVGISFTQKSDSLAINYHTYSNVFTRFYTIREDTIKLSGSGITLERNIGNEHTGLFDKAIEVFIDNESEMLFQKHKNWIKIETLEKNPNTIKFICRD